MSGLSTSLAFTALLELDPDGFGKQDMRQSGETITDFLEEFDASKQGNIWEFAKTWLADQRAAKAAAQRGAEEEKEEADWPQLSPHPAPAQSEMDTYTVRNGQLVPAEWDERDLGPSEQQIMDWQIHNDHADGAEYDQEPDHFEEPEPGQ